MTVSRMVIDGSLFMRASIYFPFQPGRPLEVVIPLSNGDAHTLILRGMVEREAEDILRKLGDAETVVRGPSGDIPLTNFLIQQDVLRQMEVDA